MISVKLTTDCQLIKDTLSPYYDSLVYDGCPSLEDFNPDLNSLWFLLYKADQVCGVIKLDYLNFALWVCHVVIHEGYRGKGSEQWGILVSEEMKNMGATKLLAITPTEPAKRYAERVGFKYVAKLTNSIKKNGHILDQHLLELNLCR